MATRGTESTGAVFNHSSSSSDSSPNDSSLSFSSDTGSSIIDIRSEHEQESSSLKEDIIIGLSKPNGSKCFPSLLVWDEVGQQLYGDILDTNHYYPIQAERDILQDHVNEIAEAIVAADAEIVIELGAGNMSKTTMLLEALDRAGKALVYYALDVNRTLLLDSVRGISERSVLKHVRVKGLLGTYDDGARWLSQNQEVCRQRKAYVWLGSSIANVPNAEAGALLGSFTPKDQMPYVAGMVIGVDGCRDLSLIKRAYDTPGGESRKWTMHALQAARDCIGDKAKTFFDDQNWDLDLRWHPDTQRFENYLRAVKPLQFDIEGTSISIEKDERIHVIGSAKWQPAQIKTLVGAQGLQVSKQWTDRKVEYHMYWLQPRI